MPEMPACEWERIWERSSFLTALNVLNRSALPVNALLRGQSGPMSVPAMEVPN